MKIDILILYEHVQRELKNACILRVLLEREGYTVRINNVAWRKGLLNTIYKPKLIISPSCQNDEGMFYILHNYIGAYNGGYKVLNLYSEQLANSSAKDMLRVKDLALKIYHCAWGLFTYKRLLDTGIDEGQIRITGSQRLDFTKPMFRNLLIDRKDLASQYGLDKGRKWIMMVGNFPAKDEQKLNYLSSVGYDNFQELKDLTKNTYYELINWYETILNDNELKDTIELIYRPHPNEIIDNKIVGLSKKYQHFHIIGDLTISEWAINIDLAYIWSSTSSIEISTAGVPVVALTPYKIKPYLEMELVKEIEKIDTVDECLIITKDILAGKIKDINKDFKEEVGMYYQISDKSASENIVDFVKDILSSDDNIIMSEFNIFKGIIKVFVYLYEYILFKLNIKLNKYLEVRFRDYRTSNFIENYYKEIRDKISE